MQEGMNVLLLLLVFLHVGSKSAIAQCMSTNCMTRNASLSLYLRVCCITSNLGKTLTIEGDDITRYILCPWVYSKSCSELRDCKTWYEKGSTVSDSYTIYPEGGTPVEVYCDMEGLVNCDDTGGWTRVGYLNMTESGANCSSGLQKRSYNNIDHPLCGRQDSNSASCTSTNFPSHGIAYSKICGQIRGYQFGHPDALRDISEGIDSYYIDGLSLTYGKNPRKHIWTFVGGRQESERDYTGCPCVNSYTGGSSRDPLSTFIGPFYYCESARGPGEPEANVLYPMDPLWDGEQCNDREAPCCPANSKMPWFYRSLDTQTSDDIELRLCSNRETTAEDTPIDIVELYIK